MLVGSAFPRPHLDCVSVLLKSTQAWLRCEVLDLAPEVGDSDGTGESKDISIAKSGEEAPDLPVLPKSCEDPDVT